MKRMVVGFVFHCGRVLLIRKTHPRWQAGKFNGVGGKLWVNETPVAAMARECREEVGIRIPEEQWKLSAVMTGPSWEVSVFGAIGDIGLARQYTDEKPAAFEIDFLPAEMIGNLRWLVPLTFDVVRRGEPEEVKITYRQ